MTVTRAQIEEEVELLIAAGISEGQIVKPNWLVDKVVTDHSDIKGSDADFYIRCAYEYLRDAVREALRHYRDAPPKVPGQLTLEGFEYVQKAYLVERDNEQMIVPVTLCTKVELLNKIDAYLAMAAGCQKHADELKRYCKKRFGV